MLVNNEESYINLNKIRDDKEKLEKLNTGRHKYLDKGGSNSLIHGNFMNKI